MMIPLMIGMKMMIIQQKIQEEVKILEKLAQDNRLMKNRVKQKN